LKELSLRIEKRKVKLLQLEALLLELAADPPPAVALELELAAA
jgi:hypothetical protein